jgi:glycosyltransferase involved in cell wall biosynthesis
LKPFVSIIIPFYNAEQTIRATIQSVIDQIFKDWEIILVDDGSTDDTIKICQEFLTNSKIRLIQQANKGVSAARNLGAFHSLGCYLVFLDADDALSKTHLKDFNNACSEKPDLVTCEMKIFVGKGEQGTFQKNNSNFQSVIPGSWIIKKSIFVILNGFDDRLKFAENTEFFFRFDQIKRKRIHISKENFYYFQSKNGGSKNIQNMIDSILIILEKHDEILTNHVKYLYHQIVGVNQLRFQRFDEARKHLWKAFLIKPYKIKTLARFGLSFLPSLSKRIYSKHISV